MIVKSPQDLALYVSDQRQKLKLSQTNVGDSVGLKQATISAFENKPDYTRLDTLFRILSAVNLDIQIIDKNAQKSSEFEW